MRVQIISPWYPQPASVFSGIFVKKQIDAINSLGIETEIEVPLIFPAPAGKIPERVLQSMDTLGARDPRALYPSFEGATFIPTPVPSRSGFAGRSKAFSTAIARKREVLPVHSDITHAHLGVPTGYAAVQLSDVPLVVTEHQSTLDRVFEQPEAKAMYIEVLKSADRFLAVSSFLKEQIVEGVGSWAEEVIEVVPNIVDLTNIPFTKSESFPFVEWIYVGSLFQHKGVQNLLRSFSHYRRKFEPAAQLTLVGDGPLKAWIERFVISHNLGNSVGLVGARDHSEVGGYLQRADVLVHLSESETFGISSIESIGAGVPVVSLMNGGAEASWGAISSLCGSLLDRNSQPEEVAEAVADLRDNPQRLDMAAARQSVESMYSSQVVARQLQAIYEEVL